MRSMKMAEAAFLTALSAFVGAFLAIGAFHYEYPLSVFGFPLVLGSLFCGLALLRAVMLWRGGDGPAVENSVGGAEGVLQTGRAWAQFGWAMLIVISVYGLGFVAGPSLYVLVYTRFYGYAWKLAALLAGGTALVLHGGFYVLLQVPIPVIPLWME